MDEIKMGVGATAIERAKSEEVVGSMMTEVRLVLLAGTVSMKVELVTVAELWMVVPAATPAFCHTTWLAPAWSVV